MSDMMVSFPFRRRRLSFPAAAMIGALLGCSDSPTQPVPDAVLVSASASTVQVGDSVSLLASYQFGSTDRPADSRVRWTSSDSTSFIVDRAGIGHALNYTGAPVTVTASASGVTGSTQLFVLPTFDSLVVTASARMTVGRIVHPTFAVSAEGTFGRYYRELAELPSKVSLASANPQAVAIEADGSIRTVAPGRSEIMAALAGDTTRILVDVFDGFPLTVLSGSGDYGVTGVNDAGAIIGSSPATGTLLRRGDAITALGACSPIDINNAGAVACHVKVDCGPSCVTTKAGVFENGALRVLDGLTSAIASGISETGIVFGQGRDSAGAMRVFLWDATGVTYLHPGGSWSGSTYHVNSAGHGVEVIERDIYLSSAAVGSSFSIGLGALGGRWADARDINDADDIVGTSERMSPDFDHGGQATVWRAANQWRPESPGYRATVAIGITEAGQVVGMGRDGAYVSQAGRYTILDDALADDGWKITQIAAVSHTRMIAALAQNSSGEKRVVLIDLGAAQ